MFYEKLFYAVKNSNLILTTIIGLPRTTSTVFGIAATSGHNVTGQIIRPFADVEAGFDGGVKNVYERAVELGIEDESRGKPVHLLVKETARRINSEKYAEKWIAINNAILFMVRDPHIQFQSLIERLANDLVVEWGASKLSFNEAMQHTDKVDELLREGGKIGSLHVPPDYSFASWKEMQKNIDTLDRAVAQGSKIRSAIVTSGVLRLDPRNTMHRIADVAGLGFNDNMILGWKGSQKDAIKLTVTRNDSDLSANAWINPALNSKSFNLPNRSPLSLDQFPDGMREYIETIAIPIYIDLLSRAEMVGPTDFNEVETLLRKETAPNTLFKDVIPTAAYALLSAAALRQADPGLDALQFERAKETIIREHAETFETSFRAIDRAVAQIKSRRARRL